MKVTKTYPSQSKFRLPEAVVSFKKRIEHETNNLQAYIT
jgi:hypothetical protein